MTIREYLELELDSSLLDSYTRLIKQLLTELDELEEAAK